MSHGGLLAGCAGEADTAAPSANKQPAQRPRPIFNGPVQELLREYIRDWAAHMPYAATTPPAPMTPASKAPLASSQQSQPAPAEGNQAEHNQPSAAEGDLSPSMVPKLVCRLHLHGPECFKPPFIGGVCMTTHVAPEVCFLHSV